MDRTGPSVVFVVGKGRSGSTLLDTALGQVPGVASTGELRHLWGWGVLGGYRCGCGEPVRDCPQWQQVLERLGERLPWTTDPAAAATVIDDTLRWPMVPRTVLAARRGTVPSRLDRFVELSGVLYDELATVADADVVVDSSKWPAHPAMLGMVDGITRSVVHLVRDPRGVASSYRRGKETGEDQPDMPRFGAVHSSLSWALRNATAELAPLVAAGVPVTRVRYEDFVVDPGATLQAILAAAGRPDPDLGFVDERTLDLGPTHTVGGNPGRFSTGPVHLRTDTRWRRDLPDRDRRLVEVLTTPLRRRYGYEAGR